jgi:thiamine-phosphate pyrophosphorylase
MQARQTRVPTRWLMADKRGAEAIETAIRRMRRGEGIVILEPLTPPALRRLRTIAAARGLTIAHEGKGVARAHGMRELRRALLSRTSILFLSPLHRTRSHPDWSPLPRMRAAAMARLAGRRLFALGGMDAARFARIRALGFIGWGGIDAWT